ncbi:MAG: ferrous iron transporter B [Syntrophomonadaceae bacterium]|nr:ferrous iron transporter B [Syntrophomonadaceae bacterium]
MGQVGVLLQTLHNIAQEIPASRANQIRDQIVKDIYCHAEKVTRKTVVREHGNFTGDWDRRVDSIVTSRVWGFPIMFGLLGLVFWITIVGAAYPGEVLATGLFALERQLSLLFNLLGAPAWLHGVLVEGMFRSVAWVVAVMLPPMAIFFPLFTLLEDIGYLPRVAFNLDRLFKKVGAHGKQALTMGMGFGCNAAGIVSARIIESPRERMIAILTNSFVPCNGRFPLLIVMAAIMAGSLAGGNLASFAAAGIVLLAVLFGVLITLGVSWLLSLTLLKGVPSTFTLELPPYRRPQVGRIIIRSVLDRTIFVLARAVAVAAPAGVLIWILANTWIGGQNLIAYLVGWLEPLGRSLSLDGYILMAFILGLPAKETVLPVLLMGYMAAGTMIELGSLNALIEVLAVEHGWTWVTALNTMLLTLLLYPCATAIITAYKEAKSLKVAALVLFMPLIIALLVTWGAAQLIRMLGLI